MHALAPAKGARTKSFRIGRGLGSGRGKTAGRGTKGQKSRSGGSNKLVLKGMKQMLLAFPKSRGFQSRFVKAATVPVAKLAAFEDGSKVDLATLKAKGLVLRTALSAKVIGGGELKKKMHLKGIATTAGAKAQIEAAGGSVK